ncbi:hypothetical protein [Brachybacterium hainanense]|uniref:Uncharacterized protein n=1 Tax=Brachybacterium hainanense TaxID=1541174 RepID=A0ABV6R7S2_9MICO
MSEAAVELLSTGLVVLGALAILASLTLSLLLAPRGTSLGQRFLWARDWSAGMPWIRLRIGLLLAGFGALGLMNTVQVSRGDPARYMEYVIRSVTESDWIFWGILTAVMAVPVTMLHIALAEDELSKDRSGRRHRIIARAVIGVLWKLPLLMIGVKALAIFLGL